MLDVIAAAVDERSARGVAAAVSRLISAGTLAPGARLPTVRAVARQLGISPTTVSEAWGSLAAAGAIQTRGRSGTFVCAAQRPRARLRYARLAAHPGLDAATDPAGPPVPAADLRDLSTGVPDFALLPSLEPALRRIGHAELTTSYLDDPVLPRLDAVLRERWPYPPQQLTVVDGALDALDRVTAAVVRFGDHVLVEDPAFPPVLDLLETVGAIPVGVALDGEGIRPDALAAALCCAPVALYLQPRAHNPTGVSMSTRRAARLAATLAGTGLVVVEDDHAGDIASAPPVSLGTRLPERTVHIRSFSKSHGPDLRLAAIGGPSTLLARVADRRLLGPGWSSRLLQAVLVDLLTDPASSAQVTRARAEYAHRRARLVAELAERGVVASAPDGINLWLPVADQQRALLTLAAHGIAVAPGTPFQLGPAATDHVRVTVGLVADGFAELAEVLALATGADTRASGSRRHALPRTAR